MRYSTGRLDNSLHLSTLTPLPMRHALLADGSLVLSTDLTISYIEITNPYEMIYLFTPAYYTHSFYRYKKEVYHF